MVMWGCYSRLFWAFPRFQVPSGTIVSARGPKDLITSMQKVEDEFLRRLPVSGYTPGDSSIQLTAELPRRVPLALRQKPGEQVTGPRQPASDTVRAESQEPAMNYDPTNSGPLGPDFSDPLWESIRIDDLHPLAPDGTISS
jgi:hypothetical protein